MPLLGNNLQDNDQSSMEISNHHEDISGISENISFLNTIDPRNEREEEGQPPEVFDKGSKLESYLSGGACCLVFIVSSILWIVLFRSLIIKNKQLSNIVYDIPTLGTYHVKYGEFFHQFDKNRDSALETQRLLSSDKVDELKEAKNIS